MKTDISRKTFFATLSGVIALFAGFNWFFHFRKRKVKATLSGPDMKTGHYIRDYQSNRSDPGGFDKKVAPSNRPEKQNIYDCTIIGGGISGLSAGRQLLKHGQENFVILELENHAGGTSAWVDKKPGMNSTAYPWGAHYLPRPSAESEHVKELLQEMGVMAADGTIAPEHLCHAPEERLFIYDRWQPGVYPRLGAKAKDIEQIQRWQKLMSHYFYARGSDGKRAFALPMALSSHDPRFTGLDALPFSEFLKQQGFDSKRLLWYLTYCMRDDFGCDLHQVSAWAGIHYFTSRSELDSDDLVWPEGNGYIARYLRNYNNKKLKTGHAVINIKPGKTHYAIAVLDKKTGNTYTIQSRQVIFAAPKFLLPYLLPGNNQAALTASKYTYSAWLVANLLLERLPPSAQPEVYWDNVIYQAKGLGYIHAAHQSFEYLKSDTVFTYYRALTANNPSHDRQWLLQTSPQKMRAEVLQDFIAPHPDIEDSLKEIQFYYWAHAMVRPAVGFLNHALFNRQVQILPRMYAAHTDISGMALFEEAQYNGIEAANATLKGV